MVSILLWIVMLIMSICISVFWIPRIATDADSFEQRIERLFDASTVQEAIEAIKDGMQDADVRIETFSVNGVDTVRTSVEVLKIEDVKK